MEKNKPVRVYAVSLGCPKNRVDTEVLVGGLGPGTAMVETPAEADLVLVNTCGFIRPAVEESVETILGLWEDISALEPRPVLAVAGCLVSRYGEDLKKELPEVDGWLSTHELEKWPQMARELLKRGETASGPRLLSTGPGHAYLKIGEGCSHKCGFCTIPSIRGPHVSRPLGELLKEAETLLGQGVSELVVVGQDVTAYGSDLGLKDGLRRLVDGLAALDKLKWLRLMYLYPAGLTDELLEYLAGVGKPLLPYFDVPVQHAHPEVLASMGRPFARDPEKVVRRIRKHFPDAVLRTTVITGYPGESDEHFQALYDFVTRTRFHHLGVFPYYAEEGTPAAAMDNQVPEEIREERRERIMELQSEISAEIMETHVGERLEVLVQGPSPEWPGLFTGRTWFQAPEVDGATYVSADPDSGVDLAPGDMVEAEIVQSTTYDLSALV